MGQVQADKLIINLNYFESTTSATTFTMYSWGQAVGDTTGVAIFNVGCTNGAPGTSANVDSNDGYNAFYNLVSVTSGKTPVSMTLPGITGYDSAYLAVATNVVPEPPASAC